MWLWFFSVVVGINVVNGTVLGLSVAVFVAAFGLRSIEGPSGILTPMLSTQCVFLHLVQQLIVGTNCSSPVCESIKYTICSHKLPLVNCLLGLMCGYLLLQFLKRRRYGVVYDFKTVRRNMFFW